MKSSVLRFNIILALFAFTFAGCKSSPDKIKGKEATFMQFHLETNPDGTPHNQTVSVYRASPILMTVEVNAALDEGFMQSAEIVDVDNHGGFAIKIGFNEEGARRLDYLTTSYKGRHLGITARWTETRWLAAPLISKRIANGVFIFTPDASREETERIVNGLRNVIKEVQKPYVF